MSMFVSVSMPQPFSMFTSISMTVSIKNESIICQNVRSLRAEADLFTSMYPIPSTVPDKYLLTD